MEGKYRIIEGIGPYFNKRWELQEKYSYYENGEKIISWHTVFHSKDKKNCEEVLQKYKTIPQKDYRMAFSGLEWS